MNSKQALKTLRGFNEVELNNDKNITKALDIIEKDLEVLEFIKTHYEMNGFDELIPSYLEYADDEKFNELGR